MAFSLAYEEALMGGTPLYLCHKSHFDGHDPQQHQQPPDRLVNSLPMPVRLGHAPLHTVLFRPDTLQRIHIKYYTSWQELLVLLFTVQHAQLGKNKLSGQSVTMIVVDDVSQLLSLIAPVTAMESQLLLLCGLLDNTLRFYRTVCETFKLILTLDTKLFSSGQPHLHQVPLTYLRYVDVQIGFIREGMAPAGPYAGGAAHYRVVKAHRSWDATRGCLSTDRQVHVLSPRCVLLAPHELPSKVLVLLLPKLPTPHNDTPQESSLDGDHQMDQPSLELI